MISGTLGKKNAREVRAFPDVWILAEHTQQGVKAVVMIPTIKDNAQHTPPDKVPAMVTEAHETSARGAKTGPQGAVLGRIGLLHPHPLIGHLFGLLLLPVSWLPIGRRPARTCGVFCHWLRSLRAYGADSTIAEIQVDHRGPRLLGHFACRSVWSCDHCAKARVAQTRSWLRSALMPALTLVACLVPVTLTLAHSYADEWSGVVAKLYEAFTLFDKRLSKHYAKAGSIGKLKALEAPVGRNGIHPHLHILLTHDASADLGGA